MLRKCYKVYANKYQSTTTAVFLTYDMAKIRTYDLRKYFRTKAVTLEEIYLPITEVLKLSPSGQLGLKY